jgi:hypothetical protein
MIGGGATLNALALWIESGNFNIDSSRGYYVPASLS